MTKNHAKIFKTTKDLTLVLAIISTIYAGWSALGVIGFLFLRLISQSAIEMGELGPLIDEMLSSPTIHIVYFEAFFYLGFCIKMFANHRRLKRGELVAKIPYYLPLIVLLINFIDVFIQGLSVTDIPEMIGYIMGSTFRLAFDGAIPVLAILALVSLNKLYQRLSDQIEKE